MDQIASVYYRSDFKAEIAIDGDVPPGTPWEAIFFTASRQHPYTAKGVGVTDGKIVVPFDNHGLAPGPLRCEITFHIPDADYPDGIRKSVHATALPIRLTTAGAPGDTDGGNMAGGTIVWPGGSTLRKDLDNLAARIDATADAVADVAAVTRQLTAWGYYKQGGVYAESTNGIYRNSGYQALNRNNTLVLTGIRGFAGMAYLTFWDERGEFVSAMTLTQNTAAPYSRVVGPGEFPKDAAYFIVSSQNSTEAPVPSYSNGLSLEQIGRTLATMAIGDATAPAPTPQKKAAAGPRVLAMGIIPLTAQPGVVYRNLGQVRVCSYADIEKHFAKTDEPLVFFLSGLSGRRIVGLNDNGQIYPPDKKDALFACDGHRLAITKEFALSAGFHRCDPPRGTIRLMLGDVGGHIWKDKGGSFHIGESGAVEPVLAPPRVKFGITVDGGAIEGLVTPIALFNWLKQYGNVEMQIRRNRKIVQRGEAFANEGEKRPCFDKDSRPEFGGKLGPRWQGIQANRNKWRGGVYRVRFKTRKRVSAWTYFFYTNTQRGARPRIIPI